MRILLFLLLLSSLKATAQKAAKLHRKAIVVDTHNDVLSAVVSTGINLENDLRGVAHSDLDRMKAGGLDVQVFSIFCNERFGPGTAFAYANREIDSLFALVARNPTRMMMVTDPSSFKTAVAKKKLGCMMGVEGGHMIEDNLAYLDSFYRRGVRYMTLTWNNSTSWATSAKDEAANTVPNSKAGLNEFGRSIVRRMNELGMMVDVSHVGEQTFRDVIATTTKPVIASHSCSHALCPHPRNLTDDQLRAIARNGGVVHLNFYSGFLDSNYMRRKEAFLSSHAKQRDSLKALNLTSYEIDEWISKLFPAEAAALRPPLALLLDHLDHIVRIAGIDHVGLGSDFDGIESAPQALDDVSGFPNITTALLQRGYSKREIRKILGENFIRVFRLNQQ
jgi:membrane dipeptidase